MYEHTGVVPQYLSAASARKACGIKVKKGEKAKQKVIEFLLDKEPQFVVEYTKYGNFKPECFDKADSIVIAKAGYLCQQNKK
tara:strand:- start:999 stop:1244 length:246 start_codon:yes stop_codon:yes gene_type:complete